MSAAKLRENRPYNERVYVLKHGDQFVCAIESTPWETVKLFFRFTKDRDKVKRFGYDDLFSPLATTPLGIEFQRGFAGRVIRIK